MWEKREREIKGELNKGEMTERKERQKGTVDIRKEMDNENEAEERSSYRQTQTDTDKHRQRQRARENTRVPAGVGSSPSPLSSNIIILFFPSVCGDASCVTREGFSRPLPSPGGPRQG